MSTKREKKFVSMIRLIELLNKHKQIILVSLDNVGSNQVQQVRRELNKKDSLLLIGKNTVITKAATLLLEDLPAGEQHEEFRTAHKRKIPELKALIDEVKGKIGFIFTDKPVFEIKTLVESNQVPAPARVGAIAPIDVTVPAGPTGMDPAQISFFHALQISTKINKGQIEITKDFPVCVAGRKIANSEVALLQKMNIKPFQYGMVVVGAYDNGAILSKEVCAITPDAILSKFQSGVKNLTALSLQTGIATELTVPHFVVNAFKNLAAIGLTIDYKFKQIAQAQAAAAAAPKADAKKEAAAPAAKKEAPKEEAPKEEEEDMDMGGLFD
jgi:large subunit ribosomal protein LP0